MRSPRRVCADRISASHEADSAGTRAKFLRCLKCDLPEPVKRVCDQLVLSAHVCGYQIQVRVAIHRLASWNEGCVSLLLGGLHAGTLHSMWWARAKPTSSLRSGVSAVLGGSSYRLSRARPGSCRSRRRVRGDRVGAGPHDQLGRQKNSCRCPMRVFE
jgi:hypothetical protein